MLKNGMKDFKENIKFLPILAVVMLSKIFFEAIESGMTEPRNIVVEIAAGLVFSFYMITALTRKSFGSFTVQSIFAILTVALLLGVVISYRLISFEVLFTVCFASFVIIASQHFYLLPVAAALSLLISFADTMPYIQSAVIICAPAAVAVSCVCLSDELKESAVWKKLVFAAEGLVLFAAAARVLYIFKFTITVHSFVTQIWSSIALLVAAIILLVFAVYAIKSKKSIGEVFGYFVAAAFGVVPAFMDMKYAFLSASVMLMMITLFVREGKTAESLFSSLIKSTASKAKNKAK